MQEILREQKKTGKLIRTVGALDGIAKAVSAVKVDKQYFAACIKKAMESKNPLNAFFKLFGYRVIRNDAAKPLVEASPGSNTVLERMLCLDKPAMNRAVAEIVDILANVESEVEQQNTDMAQRYNDLVRLLEEERQKSARLQSVAQAQVKMAAERAQYMLGLSGSDDEQSPIVKQINELLADLGISVHWSAEGASASDAAMFTVMEGGGELRGIKPCLMHGEEIIVKGVRFVETEEETVG